MPNTDIKRMKLLAASIHSVAPELSARIDAFAPAPGFPSRAIALDPHRGIDGVSPGIRVLCWIEDGEWRALRASYRPETLDAFGAEPYHQTENDDEAAPSWAFGALVWAINELSWDLLAAYGVGAMEDLPLSAREISAELGSIEYRYEKLYEP